MAVAQRMTADEFLAAPEPDHGRPWNLIDGEVIVNDPTVLHGRAQKRLLVALESWISAAEGRGSVELPADVGLDERVALELAGREELGSPLLRRFAMPMAAVFGSH